MITSRTPEGKRTPSAVLDHHHRGMLVPHHLASGLQTACPLMSMLYGLIPPLVQVLSSLSGEKRPITTQNEVGFQLASRVEEDGSLLCLQGALAGYILKGLI